MDFIAPDLPGMFPFEFASITFGATFPLSEQTYLDALAAAGRDSEFHVSCRIPMEWHERSSEIFAVIGLHREDDDCWAHTSFRLEFDDAPIDTRNAEWDALLGVLGRCDSVADAQALVRFGFKHDEVTLGVSLPIGLDGSGVEGFKEISGVRLVQRSSDGDELYSVVLDQFADRVAVNISAPIEFHIDENLFVRPAERASAILGLIADPVKEGES